MTDIKLEEEQKINKSFQKEDRLFTFKADDIATFYESLITNLGIKRAKGLLMRHGWTCGHQDALSFNREYKILCNEDLTLAIHTINSVKLFAKIETTLAKIDYNQKDWLHEGRFTFLFDVHEYTDSLSLDEMPLCWHLIGYMGGFASTILGKNVFYKEIKCINKEDPYCEFVGKPLHQWDKEMDSEMIYYEESKIGEELDASYKRIQQQEQYLEKSLYLHQQLSNLVLDGVGLDGIAETVSTFIEGTVFIYNNHLNELVFHSSYKGQRLTQLRNKLTDFFEESNTSSIFDVDNDSFKDKKAQYTYAFELAGEKYVSFVAPILGGGGILGYIATVYDSNKKMDKDLIMFLQRSANICALVIIKHKEIMNLEQQFRWNFVDALFSKMYSNKESIIAWGLRLGHDITKPHRIIAMAIEYPALLKTKSEEEIFLLRNEILRISNNYLKKFYHNVLCADIKDRIVIFLPEATFNKKIIVNVMHHLKETIENQFPKVAVFFGVGNITHTIDDYFNNYLQAKKSHIILKSYKKKSWILFYDDLGSLAVLLDVDNKQDLLEFMKRKLGPLIEYDNNHNSELIQTLEDYLSTDSLRKASKMTSLSLSGLKYRLNRIKSFGYDLQSPQERFDLQLALQIFKITQ